MNESKEKWENSTWRLSHSVCQNDFEQKSY